MTSRIQNLIDAGRLQREVASDGEVAGLRANALEAFADARVEGMSAKGRLVRAFDAGRLAATALVRSRDLRVRATNHHEMTLAVAGPLSSEELAAALRSLEDLRTLRTDAEYGWQAGVTAADANRAVEVVHTVLEQGARDLREHRPSLAQRIPFPA